MEKTESQLKLELFALKQEINSNYSFNTKINVQEIYDKRYKLKQQYKILRENRFVRELREKKLKRIMKNKK